MDQYFPISVFFSGANLIDRSAFFLFHYTPIPLSFLLSILHPFLLFQFNLPLPSIFQLFLLIQFPLPLSSILHLSLLIQFNLTLSSSILLSILHHSLSFLSHLFLSPLSSSSSFLFSTITKKEIINWIHTMYNYV